MMQSFPNILSWARIVLAPIIVVTHFLPGYGPTVALVLFALAAITDYVDGKLARELNLQSAFGVFLDPVADKVLVVIVLMLLLASPHVGVDRNILIVLAALIILRELCQASLRDWMAQRGQSEAVGVSFLSKTKTVVQMIALGFLLAHSGIVPLGVNWSWVGPVGAVLLAIAAGLGIITFGQFVKIALSK